jgi:hypothetical protein
MNIANLIRDANQIHLALEEMADGRVITTKGCKIYSPSRYVEHNLSYVGVDVYILGIFGITVEDKYLGVSLLNTMIPIDPTMTNKVKIDDDEYLEFVFAPGTTVFKSTDLVKTDSIVYRIYDEFIAKGYVPWYIGYEELGHLFDSSKEFADANIGTNPEVTQLIASMIARDPNDRTKYFRTAVDSFEEMSKKPPVYVPLKSVQYSATNTTTKLGGSYFQQGVVSALIDNSTRTENIEKLLRR